MLKNRLLKHYLPITTRWPVLKIDKFNVQNCRVVDEKHGVNFPADSGDRVAYWVSIFVKLKLHVVVRNPDDVTLGNF